jgi:hypothetical protein
MKESKAVLKARKASFENILLDVEQIPLDQHRQFLKNYDFGGQYSSVIYSHSLNKVLHFGGRNYTLVKNETLMMPIHDKLVSMFGEKGFTTQCFNEDDRRFSAQFILDEKEIKVADQDYLNVMIEVQNSYDGSLRHSIGISFFRQICSNGMMGWKKDSMVQKKHHDDLTPNLNYIIHKLDDLDEQLNQFRTLTERVITHKELDDIMETIRKQKTLVGSFPKRIIDEVPERILQEAQELGGDPTAWLVYNGFNWFLNHDERVGYAMDVKEKIDRNILDTVRHQLALN